MEMCKDVRGNGSQVCWKHLVWHLNCIHKHTFILWRAAKLKLCTQDRMFKWYPNRVFECSLCNNEVDSHDYMFFKCEYAQKLWKKVCDIANLKFKKDKWEDIVKVMSQMKGERSVWDFLRDLL
ncbi:RNA-directed DNA polymerase, eukaryota, Reverse transcriptase zinc-binding domain protein [Artemisia annua]|uniref:RNA-directed DNA polymerase, eukaryota, Reverse transcriptase zinc-binding domain protein n=1 Tax=Artemisia annua TaxID=35608 RepID=A0A2U1MNZ4_ARTAN|nr:RNA-directed DNA polymerase, eukaryota, Reverse transcriptase zinc-binding domain protein [Artemisia annua]